MAGGADHLAARLDAHRITARACGAPEIAEEDAPVQLDTKTV